MRIRVESCGICGTDQHIYHGHPGSAAVNPPIVLGYELAGEVEPVGCVLHGLKKIDVRPVHTVLIIGGGFIGQLFLQLVKKQAAAKIIVSGPALEKHERLLELGANEVVQPTSPETVRHLMNIADVVIECVGRKESMELAIKAARKGGQILLFDVPSPDTLINVSPFTIFSKELSIKGSFIVKDEKTPSSVRWR